jgi:hypothetical protein
VNESVWQAVLDREKEGEMELEDDMTDEELEEEFEGEEEDWDDREFVSDISGGESDDDGLSDLEDVGEDVSGKYSVLGPILLTYFYRMMKSPTTEKTTTRTALTLKIPHQKRSWASGKAKSQHRPERKRKQEVSMFFLPYFFTV